MNHLALNDKLNDICALVREIRNNPYMDGTSRGLDGVFEALDDIEATAGAIWSEVAGPRVVGLYLADALEQVQRVTQLMDELELPPDNRQVLALGMACELAAEKFGAWRDMVRRLNSQPGTEFNSVPRETGLAGGARRHRRRQ